MIFYDIKLYDVKTDTAPIVITLRERRRDPDRCKGRGSIERWAKSLLGEDWWLQHWHNISITQRETKPITSDIGMVEGAKGRFYDHQRREEGTHRGAL